MRCGRFDDQDRFVVRFLTGVVEAGSVHRGGYAAGEYPDPDPDTLHRGTFVFKFGFLPTTYSRTPIWNI